MNQKKKKIQAIRTRFIHILEVSNPLQKTYFEMENFIHHH